MDESLLKDSEVGRWVGDPTTIVDYPWCRIVSQWFRFQNGTEQLRIVRLDRGGAGVLALTEKQEVVLLDLPRLAIGEAHFLELPGGGISKGKTALETARDELLEETGFVAFDWEPVLSSPRMPWFDTGTHSIFFAKRARKATAEEFAKVTPDPNEIINQVLLLPIGEAFAEIGRRIVEPMTVIPLLWFQNRLLKALS